MSRSTTPVLGAVGALALALALSACGAAKKEDAPATSEPATLPVVTTAIETMTPTEAPATTAAPTPPVAPTGRATTMKITNPGEEPLINSPINAYQGPDNGVFNPDKGEVAWWARGSNFGAPGQARTSILSGHVTFDGLPDVFKNLHLAKPGALIEITYDTGTVATWKVVEVVTAKKEDVASYDTPVGQKVWGSPGLRVITCDEASGKRPDGHTVGNTVLIADRVS